MRSWTSEIPGWLIVVLYLAFDIWGGIFDQGANIGDFSHIVGGLLGIEPREEGLQTPILSRFA